MANIPLRKLTVAELLRQALDKNNLMCECIPELPENSQLEIDAITGNNFLLLFCFFYLYLRLKFKFKTVGKSEAL